MFARAGRMGYVLKPELLRRKGLEKDKDSLVRSIHQVLDIEVSSAFHHTDAILTLVQIISAQQLPRSRDALAVDAESVSMDPFVEVCLSVPGTQNPLKRRTKVVTSVIPLFCRPVCR